MRGSRGARGFPRTVVRQYLGAGGATVYDLPHRGVQRDTLIAYDETTNKTATISRGTGTNGADQVVYAVAVGAMSTAYASYTYIPGWRGEG